jgi:hypothetical protein
MAYKNPLRLTKNGHFFVSDATTLTSYLIFYKGVCRMKSEAMTKVTVGFDRCQ